MMPYHSTLKHRDVEETIDLIFYRPLGYLVTRALAGTRVTPNAVTLARMVVGLAGAHLLYYPSLRLNLIGMALFVFANLLDSVDGQLARMKQMHSRLGRLLDGWSDGLVYAGVYLHLSLRAFHEGASPAVFGLAIAAAVSQAVQNIMADYYRNAWPAIVRPGARHEMDSTDSARRMADRVREGRKIERVLLGFYVDYTGHQERVAPAVARLARAFETLPSDDPRRAAARERYARRCWPFLKLLPWNATNLRMLLMFAAVLTGHIAWFLWLTVIGLNLILLVIRTGHERGARAALAELGEAP